MTETIQAIRGMHDILPAQMPYWHQVEAAIRRLMQQYAFSEIRSPIVEKTALFKRAIGDVTDIVEKEMYTFEDRNGDSLSLRPEATAQCARAVLEHGLVNRDTPKLWYLGPMFRHERPQKGRYRQFYQLGAEVYGTTSPLADVELIAMNARLWKVLGVDANISLEINTLGTAICRKAYRAALVDYLTQHESSLDEDSKRRLTTNPLRILDSKNPDMAEMLSGAPKLIDYLSDEASAHFVAVKSALDELGIAYTENSRLVRGLDYYTHTVFEWVTTELGAQGTVCGGGRYDDLIAQLGAKNPVPAVGFSMGMERLIALLEQKAAPEACQPKVCLITLGSSAKQKGIALAESWRTQWPDIELWVEHGDTSLKSQFKRADKQGAWAAIIMGDTECEQQVVGIKFLREKGEQQTIAWDAVTEALQRGWESSNGHN